MHTRSSTRWKIRQHALLNRTIALLVLGATASNVQAERVIEEVIVEAQKREQNLQDVPVAVTAFTSENLAQAVIKDVFDLQTSVPGLIVAQNQTATTANFNIRGIGTSSQNFGLESSVGLYVDGVYRSRQSAMINNMVDLQSVEVLRGPQGTLFGKNTLAGAVLFRTQAPTFDSANAFIEATTGNYGLAGISGASSFTAIDNELAFRVSGFATQRDGYVDIIDHGNVDEDAMNDRDREGIRLQALYTPNETFSMRTIIDYSEINEACCAALTTLSNVGLASMDPDSLGTPGSDNLVALLGGTVTHGADFDNYQMAANTPPQSSNKDRGISVEMNWQMDEYTVTSVSAFRRFDSFDLIDGDFTDLDIFNATNNAEQESFSQEIRLTFSNDNMTYLVGGYYFTQTIDLDFNLNMGSQIDDLFNLSLPGAITSTDPGSPGLLLAIDGLSAATGGLVAPSAEGFPPGYVFTNQSAQDHESFAFFGQIDYTFNDAWSVSGGLRYTREEKELNATFLEDDGNGNGLGPQFLSSQELLIGATAAGVSLAEIQGGAPITAERLATLTPFQAAGWGFGLLGPLAQARPDIDTSFSENIITGSVKLIYQPNDQQLYYASLATGFKSGGTNTDRIPASFDPIFKSEKSRSLEVGMKYDSSDRSLRSNLAVHYTEIDDFQANSWTGVAFNLQNAGKLESYGLEWETQWAMLENTSANLAYAYTHATYKEFNRGTCWVATPFHTGMQDPGDSGQGFCNRSGDRIDFTPEHFINLALEQRLAINENTEARLTVEYNFRSDMVMDGDNDPIKEQGGYGKTNLRAAFGYRPYDLDIILWGRNVFDKRTKRTIFNVPTQTGRVMSYPDEPATYGITLRKQF